MSCTGDGYQQIKCQEEREVEEQYQITIRNKSAALKSLQDNKDINKL
jgi:phage-related protein